MLSVQKRKNSSPKLWAFGYAVCFFFLHNRLLTLIDVAHDLVCHHIHPLDRYLPHHARQVRRILLPLDHVHPPGGGELDRENIYSEGCWCNRCRGTWPVGMVAMSNLLTDCWTHRLRCAHSMLVRSSFTLLHTRELAPSSILLDELIPFSSWL